MSETKIQKPNKNVESFITLSKDGKYFISKTVITRIFPRKYLDKVLEGKNDESEESSHSILNDLEDNVVYSYTSQQAIEDGILVDITNVNPNWEKGMFNYITTNLLNKGYLDKEQVNVPNLIDLLTQAYEALIKTISRIKT